MSDNEQPRHETFALKAIKNNDPPKVSLPKRNGKDNAKEDTKEDTKEERGEQQ